MRTSAFFSEMPHAKVLIAGSPALSMCWQEQLRELGWDAEAMTAEEVERAYLQGTIPSFCQQERLRIAVRGCRCGCLREIRGHYRERRHG